MRRASFADTKFGGGTPVVERFAFTTGQEARAGPEGETSFPYGVNKNSCFLLAPLQAEGFAMGPARANFFQNLASGFSRKKVRILSKRHSSNKGKLWQSFLLQKQSSLAVRVL